MTDEQIFRNEIQKKLNSIELPFDVDDTAYVVKNGDIMTVKVLSIEVVKSKSGLSIYLAGLIPDLYCAKNKEYSMPVIRNFEIGVDKIYKIKQEAEKVLKEKRSG